MKKITIEKTDDNQWLIIRNNKTIIRQLLIVDFNSYKSIFYYNAEPDIVSMIIKNKIGNICNNNPDYIELQLI